MAPAAALAGDPVRDSLDRMGLLTADQPFRATALTGGVSSLILRIDAGEWRFCFKQALAKLNVAAEWYAPVERNLAEIAWIEEADRIIPGIAPEVLGTDPQANAFAMAYLPADRFPVWKARLLEGRAIPETATAAGRALAALHAATAGRAEIAARFDHSEQFHQLRIEPFLLATAAAQPSVSRELTELAAGLRSARIALVHGDFSPKNLLVGGPRGIVILDAECATFGDPAFDLAFCLTHLLLKQRLGAVVRARAEEAGAALTAAYRAGADWEPWASLERRLVRLVPALMLARVDGKSPVEYLDAAARATTRAFALERIASPAASLAELVSEWGSLGT